VTPAGFSGPVTPVNSPLAVSWLVAVSTGAGSDQTGWDSLKTRFVGLAELAGKCLASSAVPAAESVPAGALMEPPNPPGL
jgi:hypothetical protein